MDKNYWNKYYKIHGGDKEISDHDYFAYYEGYFPIMGCV